MRAEHTETCETCKTRSSGEAHCSLRVLLDTHPFLWWGNNNSKLSDVAREIISDGDNQVLLSTASAWEIAIKAALGKLPELPDDLGPFLDEQLLINGFDVLQISLEHAIGVRYLRHHHKDPFDRLLVSQALSEGVPLLSVDKDIKKYPAKVIW